MYKNINMEMIEIYTLGDSSNSLLNILGTVAKNRSIEDIEKFLNPSSSDVIHYSKLKNMDLAVEMLEKHKEKDSEFVVVIDSDGDGYTSSCILYRYLKRLIPNIKINYIMHEGRANGLTEQIMEEINKLNPDIVILPDASSNDLSQHKTLHEKGIDVLCLDHHELTGEESKFAVVVNPQLSPEHKNKQISGCTVTYKFLKALDEEYGNDWADDYLDLVALSNVSDAIEIVHPDVRYLTYKGFEKINNPFLKELAFKNAGWTKGKLFPHVLSWSILPKLNSLIRVGSAEEKLDIFEAFIGMEREFYNTRTKKTESLVQKSARLCTNSYAKQKRIRTKLVEKIKETVEREELDKNAVIFLTLDEFQEGLAGYIAGGLTNEYHRPVVLTSWNKKEDMYTGSLRGYSGGAITDVKELLEKTELFSLLAGHGNAAGVKITKENSLNLNEKINSVLQFETEKKSDIEVDFEIKGSSLSSALIDRFEEHSKLWCKGFESPRIAVTDIEVRTSDIQVGSTMKFNKGNVEIVSFSVDPEIERLTLEKDSILNCTILGTVGINRFLGKETYQLVVEKIVVNEIKEAPAKRKFQF